jgi:hypothetical protein
MKIQPDRSTGILIWALGLRNELPGGKPRSIIQLILSILPQQAAGN